MKRRISLIMVAAFLLGLFLAACQQNGAGEAPTATPPASVSEANESEVEATATATATPEPTATVTPTATPIPTATPLPPKVLTVCLSTEPENLFLYGDGSLPATGIRHGVYENMVTTLSYGYQAEGIEKLPSLADGDAVIETVLVEAGEKVVDANGDVVTLADGVVVFDANGSRVTFAGEPAPMQQMVVDFRLKPLFWSDGTPVTAGDSVFSFEVAANPETRAIPGKIPFTAEYTAVDNLGLRWTGLPGYLDSAYFTNVWTPLPRHQLGEYSAERLRRSDEARRTPLSHGPFMVSEWVDGEQITLVKNPHYYRAGEGLPHLDTVRFRFVGVLEAAADVLAECDITTQDALPLSLIPELEALAESGEAATTIQPSQAFEQVALGINSLNRYGDGERRPDWFEDVRVRQGLLQCIDRQRMVDELLNGHGEVMPAYIPSSHPLAPENLATWPFDPEAGNRLLDSAGFVDGDGDGVREVVDSGRPFTVTLMVDGGNVIREAYPAMLAADLAACGVEVETMIAPPDEFYADGPLGSVFGRRFDMAGFAWLARIQPSCHVWLSQSVTGPAEDGYGGWDNVNVTGWRNEAFDNACEAALNALPGTEAYTANHQEALRIFAQSLPILPLFTYLKVAAAQPRVQNLQLDVTQPSELWNLYALDVTFE